MGFLGFAVCQPAIELCQRIDALGKAGVDTAGFYPPGPVFIRHGAGEIHSGFRTQVQKVLHGDNAQIRDRSKGPFVGVENKHCRPL